MGDLNVPALPSTTTNTHFLSLDSSGRIYKQEISSLSVLEPSHLTVNNTVSFPGLTEDSILSDVLVRDSNGKLFYRSLSSLNSNPSPITVGSGLKLVNNEISFDLPLVYNTETISSRKIGKFSLNSTSTTAILNLYTNTTQRDLIYAHSSSNDYFKIDANGNLEISGTLKSTGLNTNSSLTTHLVIDGSGQVYKKEINPSLILNTGDGLRVNNNVLSFDDGISYDSTETKLGIGTNTGFGTLSVMNSESFTSSDPPKYSLALYGQNQLPSLLVSTDHHMSIGYNTTFSDYMLAIAGITHSRYFISRYTSSFGTETLSGSEAGPTVLIQSLSDNTSSKILELQKKVDDSPIFQAYESGLIRTYHDHQVDGRMSVGGGIHSSYELYVNGSAAKPGGGSWSTFSDKRLKKNIAPLTGSLEKLLSLQGVIYEWKKPVDHGNLHGPQVGFIAQDVKSVFPEWIDETESGYLSLSTRGFEALTVESLRELNTKLEKENRLLKAKVNDLDSRLQKLEKRFK